MAPDALLFPRTCSSSASTLRLHSPAGAPGALTCTLPSLQDFSERSCRSTISLETFAVSGVLARWLAAFERRAYVCTNVIGCRLPVISPAVRVFKFTTFEIELSRCCVFSLFRVVRHYGRCCVPRSPARCGRKLPRPSAYVPFVANLCQNEQRIQRSAFEWHRGLLPLQRQFELLADNRRKWFVLRRGTILPRRRLRTPSRRYH